MSACVCELRVLRMCLCVCVCVHAKASIDSQSVAEATALTQQPCRVASVQTSVSALTGKYQHLRFDKFIFVGTVRKTRWKRAGCQRRRPKLPDSMTLLEPRLMNTKHCCNYLIIICNWFWAGGSSIADHYHRHMGLDFLGPHAPLVTTSKLQWENTQCHRFWTRLELLVE